MYSLTFQMMQLILRQFGYTGEVHADIPARSVLKSGGRVVLVVQNGNVVSCFIFNQNKQKLYEGKEAQNILARLNVLDWRLTSPTSSSAAVRNTHSTTSPQTTPNGRASFYPRRLALPQAQMSTWPPLHRSVYFLADGVHNVEQIAVLLSCPQHSVEKAIQDLQAIGGIDRSQ